MRDLWERLTGKAEVSSSLSEADADWPFEDGPNVAVFTVRQITDDEADILYVSHSAEDGAWQFLPGFEVPVSEAKLVALKTILRLDPTVADLADLPEGFRASRARLGGKWLRELIP